MPRTKILFIGNGQYRNRGCEAITLGTIDILRNAFGNEISFIDIPYADPTSAPPSWSCHTKNYEYHPQTSTKRFSKEWCIRNLLRFTPTLRKHYLVDQYSRGMKLHIDSATAVLSLGGDNYSLDYKLPYAHMCHGEFAKKHEVPFFIWGGSVGPFDKNPHFSHVMLDHLRNTVTGIFAREERSYNYLRQHQIQNTWMMGDPAFAMEPEPVSGDHLSFEVPENAIGINLSPIMHKYCHGGDMAAWQKNAREIILAIRKNFDNPLLLIPHVTIGSQNNDYLFMKSCLQETKGLDRIHFVDDRLDARQTKWLISQLSCLIAARTHATIAAFSTGVPTVSLAYSVKAFGLNEMLFGHTNYLVPPDNLNPDSVLAATQKVMNDSSNIRDQLKTSMPTIRENAYRPGKWLKQKFQGQDCNSSIIKAPTYFTNRTKTPSSIPEAG